MKLHIFIARAPGKHGGGYFGLGVTAEQAVRAMLDTACGAPEEPYRAEPDEGGKVKPNVDRAEDCEIFADNAVHTFTQREEQFARLLTSGKVTRLPAGALELEVSDFDGALRVPGVVTGTFTTCQYIDGKWECVE